MQIISTLVFSSLGRDICLGPKKTLQYTFTFTMDLKTLDNALEKGMRCMLRQCVPGLLIATINTDCVHWLLQLCWGIENKGKHFRNDSRFISCCHLRCTSLTARPLQLTKRNLVCGNGSISAALSENAEFA